MTWTEFFANANTRYTGIVDNVDAALQEDALDLTAQALFTSDEPKEAHIWAKEETFVAGLPMASLVMQRLNVRFEYIGLVEEGTHVAAHTEVGRIVAAPVALLKAERVILNYLCHLSGIANYTARFVQALEGTGVTLLDTRKTTPGLRYLEKYAVTVGGGTNHRKNLTEMLMLKDNHIDLYGSITQACEKLRTSYSPCPPIEVECRTIAHVDEALYAGVSRIMLDNMSDDLLREALPKIPESVEAEVSGGVSLENIRHFAEISHRRPNFISVGRLTNSAPRADFSISLS
ncbi:MAG: carboxylating nicotinate-nucleotide diphosphorylase [Desulfovibrionaceae bacterium]|nr:carboxylating nicotinate-nucleotide diphosphorylase [Desulfovibrionaceae bacterium]